MTAIVKYQIGTYEGTVPVMCHPDDDSEEIISKAKSILRRQVGSFPIGIYYGSWRVISRHNDYE